MLLLELEQRLAIAFQARALHYIRDVTRSNQRGRHHYRLPTNKATASPHWQIFSLP
jgi:hypothetical protein